MNKISVVVPVYNSSTYLDDCMRSLENQTYPNWEAILVDDGSTDNSLEVSRALSQEDDRIRVYHQENQGPSAARNYGLDLAVGDYIFFLDSDDALHPLLFEEMVRQVKEHGVRMVFSNSAELESAQMITVLAAASIRDQRPSWHIGTGVESERWFHIDYLDGLSGIGGLISRDLIGPLRFDPGVAIGEDGIFKYQLFSKQVPVAYTSSPWYYYRINHHGLCHDLSLVTDKAAAEKAVRIRDSEYVKGNLEYAQIWEDMHTSRLRWAYELCKRAKDHKRCAQIKSTAQTEYAHPLFRSAFFPYRFLFALCFRYYPLYVPVSWFLRARRWLNKRLGKRR